MFQKVTIIGNLGTSPELRHLPDGTPVASFSVATNRKWKNSDGSKNEETVWFRVSAWRGLGEICDKYLHKGSQVYVEGRLAIDKNTGGPRICVDDTGQPHANFELTAHEVKFLGGKQATVNEPLVAAAQAIGGKPGPEPEPEQVGAPF